MLSMMPTQSVSILYLVLDIIRPRNSNFYLVKEKDRKFSYKIFPLKKLRTRPLSPILCLCLVFFTQALFLSFFLPTLSPPGSDAMVSSSPANLMAMEGEKKQPPPRLFVGGLNNTITGLVLRQHFQEYGLVKDAFVVENKQTRLSRGFGYVEFEDLSAAHNTLQRQHVILGKKVFEAQPRENGNKNVSTNGEMRNKIFVGGLLSTTTIQEFRSFFEIFGAVTDATLVHDKLSGRPRGFGFITYESEDSADAALEKRFHQLNGSDVEVKRANPKDNKTSSNNLRYYYESLMNNHYVYDYYPHGYYWYHHVLPFNYPSYYLLPSNYATDYYSYQSYTKDHSSGRCVLTESGEIGDVSMDFTCGNAMD
ncbi:RNA-binding protein 1 [Linum grandiflorum]